MQEIYNQLVKNMDSKRVLQNEPMSKHLTFKIGGPVDFFVKVKTIEELRNVIGIAKSNKIDYYIIGNGSNVLVPDEGIKGIVIKLELDEIEILQNKIKADAGALLSKVSLIAMENSLSGLEFAYGIPGTVGGAAVMNAGAFGSEMKDVIDTTTYLDEDINIKTINNKEHGFKYRGSIFESKNWIALNTVFLLKTGNKKEIQAKMQENLKLRKEKQPLEYPNAGSTFKRGKDFITAKLIDDAGLKGKKIGGAMISTKHAGFIVNTGDATSQDVLDLIDYTKNEIKEKFNKEIELEIRVLGK